MRTFIIKWKFRNYIINNKQKNNIFLTNIFYIWTLIYQFRVIKHVFNRMFGVLKSDKTPGPLRNLSSSLLDRDIIIRCRNFCVKESGNSFPFTFANRSKISFASPNRPFANNHLGDSGKNLKRSYALLQ